MTKKELVKRYLRRILCFIAGHRYSPDVMEYYWWGWITDSCKYCGKKSPAPAPKPKKGVNV